MMTHALDTCTVTPCVQSRTKRVMSRHRCVFRVAFVSDNTNIAALCRSCDCRSLDGPSQKAIRFGNSSEGV